MPASGRGLARLPPHARSSIRLPSRCSALSGSTSPWSVGRQTVGAVLTTSARPVAALIAAPWVVPLGACGARRAMRSGPSGALDDRRQRQRHRRLRRRRAYARRWVEFEMEVALEVERSPGGPGVRCSAPRALSGGGDLGGARERAHLLRAASRRGSRIAPTGVHDAVLAARRGVPARRGAEPHGWPAARRVAGRGLPAACSCCLPKRGVSSRAGIRSTRDSYTIEAIARPLRSRRGSAPVCGKPSGVVAAGAPRLPCGLVRVPPFNGRLFSPRLCAARRPRVPRATASCAGRSCR